MYNEGEEAASVYFVVRGSVGLRLDHTHRWVGLAGCGYCSIV